MGRPVVPLSRDKKISCPGVPLVLGQGQEQMSQDKHLCSRTSRDKITFPKEHKKQEIWSFFKKNLIYFVPGQRSLSRDICSCPCPGTKGHRDKKIFLSRDKGTTGRPVPVCPGTSRGTSRPVETLVRAPS